MRKLHQPTRFPRRDLLKAGGALLIGLAIRRRRACPGTEGVALVPGPDQPDPKSLDTWIAIHADNTATIFIGFVELGQGCSTALLQLAAEELDLDMSQVKSIRLESHTHAQSGRHGGQRVHRPRRAAHSLRCRRGAPGAVEDGVAKIECASGAPDGFKGRGVGCGRAEEIRHLRRTGGRQAFPSAVYRERLRSSLFAITKWWAREFLARTFRKRLRASMFTCSTCAFPACCMGAWCARAAKAPMATARKC